MASQTLSIATTTDEPRGAAPAKKPREIGSFAPPPVGNLLSHVAINHGPADFLGRFFPKADDLARSRGVSFSIATFEDMIKLNEKNRSTWMPISSVFDPKFCPRELAPENSYVIFGRNAQGDVVTCSGARLFDTGNQSLKDAVETLRMSYENPARDALPGEQMICTAEAPKSIRGKLYIGGVAWCRPDYRERDLPGLSVRVSRAMAISKYGLDCYVSFLISHRVATGFDQDLGYKNGEWAVDLVNTRLGTARTRFVWLYPDELLADLRDYAERMDFMRDQSAALEQSQRDQARTG